MPIASGQPPSARLQASIGKYPIGILISTYNRADKLISCLRHLETQTWKDFEVLIVVDGSTDTTLEQLERYQKTSPFPLRYLYQTNSGAARARNLGLQHLHSHVCLLLGDDIFASPNLVREHLKLHQAHPQLQEAAVGYTRWAEQGQTVTSFMRWLDRDGVQFHYGRLLAGAAPGWQHFYTSNLSLKTEYLLENPSFEGFRQYGLEDIELGYRLAMQKQLAMHFLPDAIADHLHPTTFLEVCRRALTIGGAAFQFGQLWPKQAHTLPRNPIKRALIPILSEPHFILPLLKHIANLITCLWCPNPLMTNVIMLHERLGYRQAAAKPTSSQHVPEHA